MEVVEKVLLNPSRFVVAASITLCIEKKKKGEMPRARCTPPEAQGAALFRGSPTGKAKGENSWCVGHAAFYPCFVFAE